MGCDGVQCPQWDGMPMPGFKPTVACNGVQCLGGNAHNGMGCLCQGANQQWHVMPTMPMSGCDAHSAQAQPCCCQNAAPQVPCATLLLPRNMTCSACPHTPQMQPFMVTF